MVGDVKGDNLYQERNDRGTFYRPHAQLPTATMRLAIRTQVAPQTIVAPLRALLQRMDPSVPLSGPRTMQEVMANATTAEKAQTLYLAVFALLALTLAAVGIYGLLAYSVAPRTRDIGIRLALGASQQNVACGILRQAGLLAFAGVIIGGLGALGASHLMRASLYGVGPNDPLAFAVKLPLSGSNHKPG